MVNEQPDRWATPEDFEVWRNTIVHLYIGEHRGLNEVVALMAHKHGFHATIKMYKYRLKKWGVHKYNKKQKDSEMAKAQPPTDTRQPRERQAIVAKFEQDAMTTKPAFSTIKSRELHEWPKNASSRRKVSLLPRQHVTAPEHYRLPEEVIHLSFQLGTGLVDAGLWTMGGNLTNPESNKWWGRMILSSQFFDLKKYKQAFDTLNTEFDRFATLLNHPDPGLFQGAYLAVLQLEPQVARRFLDFAAEMAAIKLPALHPLRVLLARLSQTDIYQLRHYSHRILESYLAALETKLGSANSGILVLYENLYDTLDYLSHEKEMHFVDPRAIHQRQLGQIQKLESLGLAAEAQSARLALGYAYWRHASVEEAERTNDSVLEWLQTHPKEQHSKALDLWDSLYLRFRCKTKIGTVEDVTRVGHEYIEVLKREVGPQNKRTIAAIGHLQKYYIEQGLVKEVGELEETIQKLSEMT